MTYKLYRFDGGKDRSQARTLDAEVQDKQGFVTRERTVKDGSILYRSKGGAPEVIFRKKETADVCWKGPLTEIAFEDRIWLDKDDPAAERIRSSDWIISHPIYTIKSIFFLDGNNSPVEFRFSTPGEDAVIPEVNAERTAVEREYGTRTYYDYTIAVGATAINGLTYLMQPRKGMTFKGGSAIFTYTFSNDSLNPLRGAPPICMNQDLWEKSFDSRHYYVAAPTTTTVHGLDKIVMNNKKNGEGEIIPADPGWFLDYFGGDESSTRVPVLDGTTDRTNLCKMGHIVQPWHGLFFNSAVELDVGGYSPASGIVALNPSNIGWSTGDVTYFCCPEAEDLDERDTPASLWTAGGRALKDAVLFSRYRRYTPYSNTGFGPDSWPMLWDDGTVHIVGIVYTLNGGGTWFDASKYRGVTSGDETRSWYAADLYDYGTGYDLFITGDIPDPIKICEFVFYTGTTKTASYPYNSELGYLQVGASSMYAAPYSGETWDEPGWYMDTIPNKTGRKVMLGMRWRDINTYPPLTNANARKASGYTGITEIEFEFSPVDEGNVGGKLIGIKKTAIVGGALEGWGFGLMRQANYIPPTYTAERGSERGETLTKPAPVLPWYPDRVEYRHIYITTIATDDYFPANTAHTNNELRGYPTYPILAYYNDLDEAKTVKVRLDEQFSATCETMVYSIGAGYADTPASVPANPAPDGLKYWDFIAAYPSASSDIGTGWTETPPSEEYIEELFASIKMEVFGDDIATVKKSYYMADRAAFFAGIPDSGFALFLNTNNTVILSGPNNGNITEVICPYEVLSVNTAFGFGSHASNIQDGISSTENYSYDPRTKSIVVTTGSARNVKI